MKQMNFSLDFAPSRCIFTFLQELNNFNPDLKFTYESNEKEIPFLDLKVKLNEGKISIDLYIKPTDRH